MTHGTVPPERLPAVGRIVQVLFSGQAWRVGIVTATWRDVVGATPDTFYVSLFLPDAHTMYPTVLSQSDEGKYWRFPPRVAGQ
jgi:hypothetical protein